MSTRRLLLHTTTFSAATSPPAAAAPSPNGGDMDTDSNVLMILSVLLCALICCLGINSFIRCTLRCSARLSGQPGGAAAAGLRRKAVKAFATVRYAPEVELPGLGAECVICLSEFAAGERLRLLPKCHHGFHVRCIDKWLGGHSTCPTCRGCLVETCEKIAGTASSGRPAVPVAVEEVPVVIVILPVEPEGYIRNYVETSEVCV